MIRIFHVIIGVDERASARSCLRRISRRFIRGNLQHYPYYGEGIGTLIFGRKGSRGGETIRISSAEISAERPILPVKRKIHVKLNKLINFHSLALFLALSC